MRQELAARRVVLLEPQVVKVILFRLVLSGAEAAPAARVAELPLEAHLVELAVAMVALALAAHALNTLAEAAALVGTLELAVLAAQTIQQEMLVLVALEVAVAEQIIAEALVVAVAAELAYMVKAQTGLVVH